MESRFDIVRRFLDAGYIRPDQATKILAAHSDDTPTMPLPPIRLDGMCAECGHETEKHWLKNGMCSDFGCWCSAKPETKRSACECGAAKLGATKGSPAHSRWCPEAT